MAKTKAFSICDYSPITGFVNYGQIEVSNLHDFRAAWVTKMRCKDCVAAWIAENYISGIDTCPKCGATDKRVISIR